jgi:hypothetical protein
MALKNGAGPATAETVNEARGIGTGERHKPSKPKSKTSQGNGRAGNVWYCANCGRLINPKRASRRQRFCTYRCRDEARRARDFAEYYPNRPNPRSVENRPLVSTICKANFVDRASIIGPRVVIEIEIIADRDWKSVTSPDGVVCEVVRFASEKIDVATRSEAAELSTTISSDLSIPKFLRRLPPEVAS